MTTARRLVVNADDFGLSAGVNEGVIMAHVRGIVTSASLMVRQPAAADAAVLGRQHPSLAVGLHLDLGEWRYENGSWRARYEVVDLSDGSAVAAEAQHQLELFRTLVGRDPTHLDSHQHVHRREPVRSVMLALASELNVPLRHFAAGIQYCGRFYGRTTEGEPLPTAITVDALISVLETLPAGVTELACHPASRAEGATTYTIERVREMQALCDVRVRQTVARHGIELHSFGRVTAGDELSRAPAAGQVS